MNGRIINTIKIILSTILLIMMMRFCLIYSNTKHLVIKNGLNSISTWNPNSSEQWLAKLENDMARDIAFSDDKSKTYMNLYPDMYVETIKPIIQLQERKIAYLTFDDGPSQITKKILNILDEQNVKATFFVMGCTITGEGEECLKAMIEQGHTIGIHTYSHNYKKIYASVESYLDDFYQVYQLIYEVTGVKVNIFRFPWGSVNSYNKKIYNDLVDEMERRGFTFYDWNVSAEDSIGRTTEYRIKRNVYKDFVKYKNPIILMHDSPINRLTVKTLPDIIETIKEKNYSFDTLNHREPFQFGRK